MDKILNTKYGGLIFSLLSGLGYFFLVMALISETKYSYLLGIFFFPTIVCGAAVCILKTIKAWQEEGKFENIRRLMYIHVVLFVFSAIYAALIYIF